MIDPECHSSRKRRSPVASKSAIRRKVEPNSSDSHEFNDTTECSPMPLLGPHSSPDQIQSFLRARKRTTSDESYFVSPSMQQERPRMGFITTDPLAMKRMLESPTISIKKVRNKPRRAAKGHPKSPLIPDRFIPSRELDEPPSTPFRMNKLPQTLSPEEKLLRRRSPKADPFIPTRLRTIIDQKPRNEHITNPHYGPHLVNDLAVARAHNPHVSSEALRQISAGAIWNVGGTSVVNGRSSLAVPDGAGGHLGSGTTAPIYSANFLRPRAVPVERRDKHESRLAIALDIDPSARLLKNSKLWPLLESKLCPSSPDYERLAPHVWKDNAWKKGGRDQWSSKGTKEDKSRIVPFRPFRILDAPGLRNDFYCSTLAYSPTSGILAVGLGHRVFLWTEDKAVEFPSHVGQHPSNWVASLSFSSEDGGKSILAVGRHIGLLSIWSTKDSTVRFEVTHPSSITCVAFKPTKSRRLSERFPGIEVDTEDLVVGDDQGTVWYYSVEWPDDEVRNNLDWNGSVTLLARISAHTQLICGLSWSPDGTYLATGGNDNACLLFDLREILPSQELHCAAESFSLRRSLRMQCQSALSCLTASANTRRFLNRRQLVSQLFPSWTPSNANPAPNSLLNSNGYLIAGGDRTVMVPLNRHKHRLMHAAAVKAIAFAPWQPSLLATGGGSNDRSIHFFHTLSGACLATIKVHAQVTSLIWSKTRREIVATFGYAQPEHPFRIAVFAWPSCEQIAAIPWGPYGKSWDDNGSNSPVDHGRALCAVSYPGRLRELDLSLPDSRVTSNGTVRCRRSEPYRPEVVRPRAKEGGVWCPRTIDEGCIIIASSDQTIKFHEIWSGPRRSTLEASGSRPLGGSEILEGLEGLEKTGSEIIR